MALDFALEPSGGAVVVKAPPDEDDDPPDDAEAAFPIAPWSHSTAPARYLSCLK
jgi:hypothetical protein